MPGQLQAPIAAFILTNPSSQRVQINPVHLNFNYWSPTSSTSTITNAIMYAAVSTSTTSTVAISNTIAQLNPTAVFQMNQPVFINPGQSLDIEVRGNIAASTPAGMLLTSQIPALGVVAVDQLGNSHNGPNQPITGHHVYIMAPALSITASPTAEQVSHIILSGTLGNSVHTLDFLPTNAEEQLSKITLRFESSVGGLGNLGGFVNVNSVRLYRGDSEIGQAYFYQMTTTTADVAFNFVNPVILPAGQHTQLTVKVDMANSGSGADATQFMVKVKSNSNFDLEVRTASGGLMLPSQITLAPGNAPSNWFLEHDAAPIATVLPVGPNHVIGQIDEIARFEIRNNGQVYVDLDNLSFDVSGAGFTNATSSTSTYDRVDTFRLYDNNNTYIASPDVVRQLTPTSATTTVRFSNVGSQNAGWEANEIIPVGGGTRTYSLRANTSNIRAAGGPQARVLTTIINGQRGHVDGNSQSEPNWADGNIGYGYTPLGYSTLRTGFTASDSYPVTAPMVQYN
jgi:hypothetical protein